MRLLLLFCALAGSLLAAVPPDLAEAFKNYRGDPPHEWSYTQTTSAEGKSTVERCDATKVEFQRWSLVQKDGRAPTADEIKDYTEGRSRRSRTGTAPRLVDQLDLDSIEALESTAERATYRFRLRPGESRDHTAPFLRVKIVLHKPTKTVESIELGNASEFSPTFGVKISEMKTLLTYSLPQGATPALPQKVETRVRGRAFMLKSLDAEMTVIFSDYAKATKK